MLLQVGRHALQGAEHGQRGGRGGGEGGPPGLDLEAVAVEVVIAQQPRGVEEVVCDLGGVLYLVGRLLEVPDFPDNMSYLK